MEFRLTGEFVELDNLLKAMHLVGSGGQAKQCIQSGLVKINGHAETRIRRKLRVGDCVEFGQQRVMIVA